LRTSRGTPNYRTVQAGGSLTLSRPHSSAQEHPGRIAPRRPFESRRRRLGRLSEEQISDSHDSDVTVKSTPWPTIMAVFITLVIPHASSGQETIPFDSPRWQPIDAEVLEHLGRPALRGTAVLSDAHFRNGVIEFDVCVDGQRSYPGVLFRIQGEDAYEHIYIRPHRAGLYPDAIQYAPVEHGIGAWQLYNGPGYTAPLSIVENVWVPVRIEVLGHQARVFVGGDSTPALVVPHLQLDTVTGAIGLSGPTDGSAYFSDFRYREETALAFDPAPAEVVRADAIRDWWVSRSYPADRVRRDRYPHFYSIFGAGWQHVEAAPTGLVDIGRLMGRKNA
jgi:hypothetical protein